MRSAQLGRSPSKLIKLKQVSAPIQKYCLAFPPSILPFILPSFLPLSLPPLYLCFLPDFFLFSKFLLSSYLFFNFTCSFLRKVRNTIHLFRKGDANQYQKTDNWFVWYPIVISRNKMEGIILKSRFQPYPSPLPIFPFLLQLLSPLCQIQLLIPQNARYHICGGFH